MYKRMVCSITCTISAIFIIGMIYFYNASYQSKAGDIYKNQLNHQQQAAYDRIIKERLGISAKGYILGFILSLFIIFFNYKKKSLKTSATVCLVLTTCFITNYFYYILSPKSDWMLNHVVSKEQTQAWLQMYRTCSYNYHMGLVLGIVGMGVFAYAFRC
jgi:amino acid permease